MARAKSRRRRARRVVVLYGTTEGHSAKVAAAIGATLRDEGLEADVFDAAAGTPDAEAYDGAVIVASVHAGDYRAEALDWARRHARALNAVPSAFVTVSLGELQHDPKVSRDLQAIRERFLERTGWKPSATLSIAGALMYSRYNLLTRLMMKRIAAQAGGDTDTDRDYDYTDWKALARFTRRFATRLGR
jgi:menaquinone-dependent protoporphyrinogen oxidase